MLRCRRFLTFLELCFGRFYIHYTSSLLLHLATRRQRRNDITWHKILLQSLSAHPLREVADVRQWLNWNIRGGELNIQVQDLSVAVCHVALQKNLTWRTLRAINWRCENGVPLPPMTLILGRAHIIKEGLVECDWKWLPDISYPNLFIPRRFVA